MTKKTEKKWRLKDEDLWQKLCALPDFEKAFQSACDIALSRSWGSRLSVIIQLSKGVSSILCFPISDIVEIQGKKP